MKRFEVGSRVVEPTYGLGSVIAVEDAYTRVQFDEHGVKKFMTSMSKLEPSNEPVPAGLKSGKPRKKRTTKAKGAGPGAAGEEKNPTGYTTARSLRLTARQSPSRAMDFAGWHPGNLPSRLACSRRCAR